MNRNKLPLLALLACLLPFGAVQAGAPASAYCVSHPSDPSCTPPATGSGANINSGSANYGGAPAAGTPTAFQSQLAIWESSSQLWEGDSPSAAWTPQFSGQTFTVLGLGFATSPAIGCGDFNPGDLVANAKNEINGIKGYIMSAGPQMALTYLLYSQPTLASAMEWLQTHVDKLEQLTLASCESVAQQGMNDANRQIQADAMKACVNDGHTSMECNQSAVIKPYLDSQTKFDTNVMSDAAGSLAGVGNTAYNSVALTGSTYGGSSSCVGGMCPGKTGTSSGTPGPSPAMSDPCLSGTPPCGSADLIKSAIVDPNTQALVPKLLGNVVHGTNGTTVTPRTGSVIGIAAPARQDFMTMIQAFVTATPQQIETESSSPLIPFAKFPGVAPPTPQVVSQLKAKMLSDPTTESVAVSVLADADVRAYLNQIFGQIITAAATVKASIPAQNLPPDVVAGMDEQIAALRHEMDQYLQSQQDQEDQLKAQKAVSTALSQGRP